MSTGFVFRHAVAATSYIPGLEPPELGACLGACRPPAPAASAWCPCASAAPLHLAAHALHVKDKGRRPSSSTGLPRVVFVLPNSYSETQEYGGYKYENCVITLITGNHGEAA